MAWNDPVLGGDNSLIREEIKSPNYVAGSSGWDIRKDGSAEFNNVTSRGTVEVDGASSSYVKLYNQVPFGPKIEFRGQADADLASVLFTGNSFQINGANNFAGIDLNQTFNTIYLSVLGGTIAVQGQLTVTDDITNVNDGMLYMRGQRSSVNVTFAAAATFVQAVTFPVAFPVGVVPTVLPNINALAGVTAKYHVRAANVSNTGFSLWCTSGDGTASAWTGVNVTYIALVD